MRSTRHLIRLASLLSVVFVLSFAGCAGYQYGSESLFRQGVRTVHVPIVRNETFRHDLGVRLTEAIVKEVERRTPYKVVSDPAADSILRCTVSNQAKRVLTETENDDARALDTAVSVRASWTDRRGQLLMQNSITPVGDGLITFGQDSRFRPRGGSVDRHGQPGRDREFGRTHRVTDGNALVRPNETRGSARATRWDLGKRTLTFSSRPLVMGILNVTPDSFSDGGKFVKAEAAIAAALQMQSDGADIIDIGGESTRPGSRPVSAADEIARVIPVIEGLGGRLSVPISIDTSKASVAEAAIAAGAELINDVTGLTGDAAMVDLATGSGVGVCVMHMKGTPQTMQDDPAYDDVVEEIADYLVRRFDDCVQRGIRPDRICLDPGVGFGKTHQHNLTLLRAIDRFVRIGSPILVGHSRKGFIGKLLGDKSADRTAATLGVSLAVAAAGAHVIRVHDVKETSQALKLFEAAGGLSGGLRTT